MCVKCREIELVIGCLQPPCRLNFNLLDYDMVISLWGIHCWNCILRHNSEKLENR